MDDKPVTYVRFSRRTRGLSYLTSCATVPFLTILIVWAIKSGSLFLWLYLGPDKWQFPALDPNNLLLAIVLAFLFSGIMAVLFWPPKRIDKFIDWLFGL